MVHVLRDRDGAGSGVLQRVLARHERLGWRRRDKAGSDNPRDNLCVQLTTVDRVTSFQEREILLDRENTLQCDLN